MPDASRQVATRVKPETYTVLQLGLVVEGVGTIQDLLRPVVEAYAAGLAKEPEIREMLNSAEKYKARKSNVRSLPSRRGGGSSKGRSKSKR